MRHTKLPVILAGALVVAALPALIFFTRPPLLIVTDIPFVELYGENRLKQQQFAASVALFRQVKPVLVADGASPDMLVLAVTEASARPFCVIFPRSQMQAAGRYHQNLPEIPVALLNGLGSSSGLPASDGILCVYGTNIETDLYRAGLFAGILGTASPKKAEQSKTEEEKEAPDVKEAPAQRVYVLWQNRSVQAAGRELFSAGVREHDPEAAVSFTSNAAGMPNAERIACAVLTGSGAEYFEKNPRMPLILFSWIDPVFTSREVAVIFDDSPWALAAEAAQMAVQGEAEGKIPSKPLILSGKTADNNVFRLLKKSAKKEP